MQNPQNGFWRQTEPEKKQNCVQNGGRQTALTFGAVNWFSTQMGSKKWPPFWFRWVVKGCFFVRFGWVPGAGFCAISVRSIRHHSGWLQRGLGFNWLWNSRPIGFNCIRARTEQGSNAFTTKYEPKAFSRTMSSGSSRVVALDRISIRRGMHAPFPLAIHCKKSERTSFMHGQITGPGLLLKSIGWSVLACSGAALR